MTKKCFYPCESFDTSADSKGLRGVLLSSAVENRLSPVCQKASEGVCHLLPWGIQHVVQ